MNGKKYVSNQCLHNVICNLFAGSNSASLDVEFLLLTMTSVSYESYEAATYTTITALLLLTFDISKAISRPGVRMLYTFYAIHNKKT